MTELLLLKSNNKVYSIEQEIIAHDIKMLTNTSPAPYVASASSVSSASYHPYKAFNGTSNNATDCWVTASGSVTGYVQIDFGTEKKVDVISITSRNSPEGISQAPKRFKVLSSTDGISFINVGEFYSENWGINEERTFKIESTNAKVMRVEIEENNGNSSQSSIAEIMFFYRDTIKLIYGSIDSLIKYNSSTTIYGFKSIFINKNYILQDTVSKNEDGLWVQEIDRKPLSIKFE